MYFPYENFIIQGQSEQAAKAAQLKMKAAQLKMQILAVVLALSPLTTHCAVSTLGTIHFLWQGVGCMVRMKGGGRSPKILGSLRGDIENMPIGV